MFTTPFTTRREYIFLLQLSSHSLHHQLTTSRHSLTPLASYSKVIPAQILHHTLVLSSMPCTTLFPPKPSPTSYYLPSALALICIVNQRTVSSIAASQNRRVLSVLFTTILVYEHDTFLSISPTYHLQPRNTPSQHSIITWEYRSNNH